MARRIGNGSWILLVGLLAAIGLSPLIMRGNSAENSRIEQNQQRILALSPAERDRIERNYEIYKNLSEGDRLRWREFHALLKRDAEQDKGRLTKTMNDYYGWLQTVTGARRDDLQRAKTLPEKVELVSTIVDERLAESAAQGVNDDPRRFPERLMLLGPNELNTVMDIVAARGRIYESDLQDDDGEPLVGLARNLRILQVYGANNLQTNSSQRRLFELFRPTATFNELLEKLPESARDAFPDEERVGMRTFRLVSSIRLSLRYENDRELAAASTSPVELQKALESMPSDRRDNLWDFSADEIKSELRRELVSQKMQELNGIDPAVITSVFAMPLPEGRTDQPLNDRQRFRLERIRRAGGFGGPPTRDGDDPPSGEDRPRDGDRPSN